MAENIIDVIIPDIGSSDPVDVIEISVAAGDDVAEGDTLIVLESEKASMDIPAEHPGKVVEIKLAVGDKVKEGALILTMEVTADINVPAAPKTDSAKIDNKPADTSAAPSISPAPPPIPGNIYASPAVRRLAREFGVDLTQVSPTGSKGRILKSDMQAYVKMRLAGGAPTGSGLPTMPEVDHAKFGDVETIELNKIKRLTGKNLHRNWVVIPHVTQFDEADITDLESFRKKHKAKAEKKGCKLTPLVFIMKAVVSALKAYPSFNSSLSPDGATLIMKKYFHIGVAVDTPNGLVVPVIRDVDQKGALELAEELAEISQKARDGLLRPVDMQGSSFAISSLGGIGGTAFTPIVNAPDVGILGVSKAALKPHYQEVKKEMQWVPRLMLPLSLSYDHRVIDGAEAARFITHVSSHLADVRQLVL